MPLTVVKGNTKVRHIRFKRNPGPECPKLRSDGSSAASDVSSLGHGPHKRSCLSPFEVTYHMGRPNQEIIELFGSDIGHPDTVVSVQAGSGATFHTSCSLRLQCGQTDASGNFTLTGLLDSTGKMTHPVRGHRHLALRGAAASRAGGCKAGQAQCISCLLNSNIVFYKSLI